MSIYISPPPRHKALKLRIRLSPDGSRAFAKRKTSVTSLYWYNETLQVYLECANQQATIWIFITETLINIQLICGFISSQMSRCISADPVVLVQPVAGVVSLDSLPRLWLCGCCARSGGNQPSPYMFFHLPVLFSFSLYRSVLRCICNNFFDTVSSC